MTLSQLGWDSVCEAAWTSSERGAHFPARVVEVQKNAWKLAATSEAFLAQLAGRLRHRLTRFEEWPAVGDWVETDGVAIHDVLPRQTKISRKAAGLIIPGKFSSMEAVRSS